MDPEFVFRLFLILVSVVCLVSIVVYYSSCVASASGDVRLTEGMDGAEGVEGMPENRWKGLNMQETAGPEGAAGNAPRPYEPPLVEARGSRSGPAGAGHPGLAQAAPAPRAAAKPPLVREGFSGMGGGPAPPPAPASRQMPPSLQPSDLVPKASKEEDEFAALHPCGQGGSYGVNFLEAGAAIGMSTNLERNANLQLRPDPVIEYKNVSVWNQSTIRPDCFKNRDDLEIGM